MSVVKAPRPNSQPPAVFDIDAAAKPGDGSGQGSGRKAAGAEEDEEDDLTLEDEVEAGSEAHEKAPARRVDYFA